MRMIAIDEIKQGMVLGKSIYDKEHKLLLGGGFRLNPSIKAKLKEKGYGHIYIVEEDTEDAVPEDIISEEVRFQARSNLEDASDEYLKSFEFKDMSRNKVFEMLKSDSYPFSNITANMRNAVIEILEEISTTGSKFLATMLLKSDETFLTDHSINTTILSILIGIKYRMSKLELIDLALGAFLHDFGKIVIEKLVKSNKKLANELKDEHPTFGYLIVNKSHSASPVVSQIVNQHHEHQDGTGYPAGLIGENLPPTRAVQRKSGGYIFRLAEVCSVADAYDKMVVNPRIKKSLTPSEAIKNIVLDAGTIFNSHVVKTLTSIVPCFPVGTYVKIAYMFDASLIGCGGVVVKINQRNLNKPVIVLLHDSAKQKIPPRMLDTSKYSHIVLELML